jgi:ADP-ribosylglycohydrolase
MKKNILLVFLVTSYSTFSQTSKATHTYSNNSLAKSKGKNYIINRDEYENRLHGFWLGQCIANWTGLITEMDKIGIPDKNGNGKGFYTRANWGAADEPNIWNSNQFSKTIDFWIQKKNGIWGANDDTDIEYIYQEAILENNNLILSGEQISKAWLKHIKKEEENYLWVSNQAAYNLMEKGILPPATSDPKNNPEYDMIDAQLTTEIFGFYAPTNPELALKISNLPIRTTASQNAASIAEFYVSMYSLAAISESYPDIKTQVFSMAEKASKNLQKESYSYKIYQFVKQKYKSGLTWEQTRDALNQKYQINQEDGYKWATEEKGCNGCFAAGINFGASLISLFYGQGDIKETIKIGTLCGWDSDNPTATWGGLLGFMYGKNQLFKIFGNDVSNQFNIHRTRINFPNNGIDTFENMAQKGVKIVDKAVTELMNGKIDKKSNSWIIPK